MQKRHIKVYFCAAWLTFVCAASISFTAASSPAEEQAWIARRAANWPDTLKWSRSWLLGEPDNDLAKRFCFEALLMMGKPDDAEAYLKNISSKHDRENYFYCWSILEEFRGNVKRSRFYSDKCFEASKGKHWGEQRSRVLWLCGDYKLSLEALTKGQTPVNWFLSGGQQGTSSESIRGVRQLLLQGKVKEVRWLLTNCDLSRCLCLSRNQLLDLAQCCLESDLKGAATMLYESVARTNVRDSAALSMAAAGLARCEKKDKAITVAELSRRANPPAGTKALLCIAEGFLAAGFRDESARYARLAMQTGERKSAQDVRATAACLRQSGSPTEALKMLISVESACAHDESYWSERSCCHGRYPTIAALEDNSRAIELKPDSYSLMETRFFLLSGLNRTNEAFRVLESLMRIAPDKWEPYDYRAYIYRKHLQPDLADQDFQKAIALARAASVKLDLTVKRVKLQQSLGRNSRAIRILDEALLADSSSSALKSLRKDLSAELGSAKNFLQLKAVPESSEANSAVELKRRLTLAPFLRGVKTGRDCKARLASEERRFETLASDHLKAQSLLKQSSILFSFGRLTACSSRLKQAQQWEDSADAREIQRKCDALIKQYGLR